MSPVPEEPLQMDLFGGARPTSEIPRMNCTNDEDCKAEADEHVSTCPVEQQLRRDLGF